MKFLNIPKKSLGQNFLIDKNIISKIIKIGNINKNKIITVHSTDAHYDWYSLIYLQLEPDLFYKPVKNN